MTIIKKFETQEKKVLPKKFLVICFSLFFLAFLEIWVNNTMAQFGQKLSDINSRQQSLFLENQVLENDIARESSLENIASISAGLGFKSPTSVQYLR